MEMRSPLRLSLALFVWTAVLGPLAAQDAKENAPQAPAGGPAVPVFAGDTPPPGPEFCPPTDATPSRVPFQEPRKYFNAFDEFSPQPPGKFVYGGVGPIALAREELGGSVGITIDPGVNIPGVPPNVDTGNLPPPGAPSAGGLNIAPADYHWGVQATFGIQLGAKAWEVNGFYIPEQREFGELILPGRLDLSFANSPPPLGFLGNNFLFLQADIVRVELERELASAEFIRRHRWTPWFETHMGVRFFSLREQLGITVEDDTVALGVFDPFRTATVASSVHNRIYGFQIGSDIEFNLVPILTAGVGAKAMIGYNDVDIEQSLTRGDGFAGPRGSQSDQRISGLSEFNAYVVLWINENVRLRTGYQAIVVYGVVNVEEQISGNLLTPATNPIEGDIIVYHGPRLEIQFAW